MTGNLAGLFLVWKHWLSEPATVLSDWVTTAFQFPSITSYLLAAGDKQDTFKVSKMWYSWILQKIIECDLHERNNAQVKDTLSFNVASLVQKYIKFIELNWFNQVLGHVCFSSYYPTETSPPPSTPTVRDAELSNSLKGSDCSLPS